MIKINEVEYPTKASLIRTCQANWKVLPNINARPQMIPLEQVSFWTSLMAFNSRTLEKIAMLPDRYAGFGYQQNPDKSYQTEAQIGVMDEAGNFMSLSWHHAVKEAFDPGVSQSREQLISDIKFGFRRAIKPQIDEQRRQRLRHGRIQCEETGVWCQPKDIHIDHHPTGFDHIANQFLACLQEDFNLQLNFDLLHRTHIDDPMHCRFKDEKIDTAWQLWHQEAAQLRAVTQQVNLSKAR